MAAKAGKTKTEYACSACGSVYPKWAGKCEACGEWNTLEQRDVSAIPLKVAQSGYAGAVSALVTLDQVDVTETARYQTGNGEFDRVLGGGIVHGSTILIGGDPGAGKSTLLLQTVCHIAEHSPVIYVSGEESLQQIADRANRLQLPKNKVQAVCETDVSKITALIERHRPALLIADSVQTLFHPNCESAPGSNAQIRESASFLNQVAKRTGTAIIFVGHITKNDSLAGPKALEHIVDATLMLTSNEDSRYRILRAEKNRFGNVSEIGIFAMTGTGLKEVKNPSAIFLSRSTIDAPGTVVAPLWEGTRPLMVEVQALLDTSPLGNPRRVSVGVDNTRVSMLLAVLSRHGNLSAHDQDVFINIVGGIKVNETSTDLAILMAAASSFKNRPIDSGAIVFGEVGLSGEIRPCANGQERLREAVKLGFKTAIVPEANAPREPIEGLRILPFASLRQAVEWL